MRELIAARNWLTVFRFPSYTPDLNPAEGLWAHLKNSLANLAPCGIDELAALSRTRPNGPPVCVSAFRGSASASVCAVRVRFTPAVAASCDSSVFSPARAACSA
ncbi:transposase [Streptomyces sp. NPDC051597]|uniref:transposase n=1 Tax=Streptomyces sp. NPDC051597 TaxID=3155049 RepID=UPI00341B481F